MANGNGGDNMGTDRTIKFLLAIISGAFIIILGILSMLYHNVQDQLTTRINTSLSNRQALYDLKNEMYKTNTSEDEQIKYLWKYYDGLENRITAIEQFEGRRK